MRPCESSKHSILVESSRFQILGLLKVRDQVLFKGVFRTLGVLSEMNPNPTLNRGCGTWVVLGAFLAGQGVHAMRTHSEYLVLSHIILATKPKELA